MSEITVDEIKELREMTSCGVIECKKALEEAGGDKNKAKDILRKRGAELAAKKGARSATEGKIEAYIHAGSKIGVIVEINCETDPVAKTDEFNSFCRDVAMQIAAVSPKYVSSEDIPEAELNEQKDKDAYVKQVCLLNQPYIKDSKKTVQDLLTDLIGKTGENIFINRFVRYKVNEVE